MANIGNDKIAGAKRPTSDVQQFYSGKTILLTGSTGYMGMCYVEKLLRGCPDIKRIYALVREKRGTPAEDRIKKYFEDTLFDTLRSMGTDFESKLHLVEGDLHKEDAGLSAKDTEMLIEEVNIIVHSASNVKFMERLSTALKINVLGTEAMLKLAKRCKNMQGFMYVSTAFSHCYKKTIMEETYESPADMKTVQDLIAADSLCSEGINEGNLTNILGQFPNTYTFTKAIAEGLVDEAGKEASFPCVIHRPSVVMPSWKEPVKYWCANVNGPIVFLLGYALGIIHVGFYGNRKLDLIPVDMAINSMIVSMRDAVKERPSVAGALVYNYGSSVEKPTSLRHMRDGAAPNDRTLDPPASRAVWKNFVYFTNCVWYFLILHAVFHYIPAALYDAYLIIKGKKAQAVPQLNKLASHYKMLLYFLSGEFRIDVSETNNAVNRMSEIDRELFFCDIRKLDWKDYHSNCWEGMRVNTLKDPVTTIPAARRKMRILVPLHYTIKYAIILMIGYTLLRMLGLY